MNMVEIQQRGIEFLRSVQKVGTSYRALGLAERSSTDDTSTCARHGNERVRDASRSRWRGVNADGERSVRALA